MSTTTSNPAPRRGRGRLVAIVGIAGLGAAMLIGVFAVWLVFFSSDAPDAPSIEDAASVLQASPAP